MMSNSISLTSIPDDAKSERLAYVLLTIAGVVWPASFIFANEHKISAFETSMIRGYSVLLVCLGLGRYMKTDLTFKDPYNFKWHMWRNTWVVFQGIVFAGSQFYLPLPIVNTINCFSPISAFIWDYFMNGVTINKKQCIGLAVCIIGVLLVVNGALLLSLITGSTQYETKFKNYQSEDPFVMTIAAVVMMIAAVAHGYGSVIAKKFVNTDAVQINYVQAITLIGVGSLLYPIRSGDDKPIEISTLLSAFLYTGLPLAICHLCFIGGLRLSKNTGVLSLFQFLAIIFGYLVSIFRYGEAVNMFCLAGSILIVLGIMRIIFCKTIPVA